jgi:hypothetical protein
LFIQILALDPDVNLRTKVKEPLFEGVTVVLSTGLVFNVFAIPLVEAKCKLITWSVIRGRNKSLHFLIHPMLRSELAKFPSILDRSTFNATLKSPTTGTDQERIASTQYRFSAKVHNPVTMITRPCLVRRDVTVEAVNSRCDKAACDRFTTTKMTLWGSVVVDLLKALFHL